MDKTFYDTFNPQFDASTTVTVWNKRDDLVLSKLKVKIKNMTTVDKDRK